MRIVVTLDSQSRVVEVDPDGTAVVVDGVRQPVKLVRTTGAVAELEVAGERVVVEGWPEYLPAAPSEITVSGERYRLQIERDARTVGPARPIPVAAERPAVAPAEAGRAGMPVAPPMPGKVVELRVKEGQRVDAGQVLLVVEAMKMRNEVVSPVAGVVRGLRVAAGANARARETMLTIAPD